MRPVLVLALFILGTLFVSAQIQVPTTHLDGEHGWAGPHPHQLVSYNVKVGCTRYVWGPATTVLSSVPGNGLVITSITAVTDYLNVTGNINHQIRILSNTTTRIGQWDFNSQKSTSGAYQPTNMVHFRHGLTVPKGAPLSIQATAPQGGHPTGVPLSVTITGYTW